MSGTSRSGRRGTLNEEKALKGTLQKCRVINHTKNKALQNGNPEAPDFLDDIAKKEYEEKAQMLLKQGVFKEGDETALAIYADAVSRWRRAVEIIHQLGIMYVNGVKRDEDGNVIKKYTEKNKAITVANQAIEVIMRYSVDFGFTPLTRQKIRFEPEKDVNRWEFFTNNGIKKLG